MSRPIRGRDSLIEDLGVALRKRITNWSRDDAKPFPSPQLNIHLGVKKEKGVYTKNVQIEKEMTEASGSPEKVEALINQILTDIFISYFSNPY